MKIKIKAVNNKYIPEFNNKGEWMDLIASGDTILRAPHSHYKTRITKFDSTIIPLGVAIELPKYFEAIIAPRSSTFKTHNVIMWNSIGVVDSFYNDNDDIWGFPVIALDNSTINDGDRICQFRIQPSQFAPFWVKLKWLFTRRIKFVLVDSLNNNNRGGFGSTGV